MISEGSCDTEDWSNDALITGINDTLLYIHNSFMTAQLFYIVIIFHNIAVFTVYKCSISENNRLVSKA